MIDAESLAFLKRSTPRNHHGVKEASGTGGPRHSDRWTGGDTLDGGDDRIFANHDGPGVLGIVTDKAAHELWSDTDF